VPYAWAEFGLKVWGGGYIPSPPSPSLFFLSLLSLSLEVAPLNPARGSGEHCIYSSWVWSGDPAEIEFGAF